MIHVLAIITTKPDKREEVLSAFNAIVPTVLTEEGCIEYGPTIDATDAPSMQAELGPDTFVVIEKWTSSITLDAHSTAAHMVTYGEKVKHLVLDRVIYITSPAR